jgi:hypothetical protein
LGVCEVAKKQQMKTVTLDVAGTWAHGVRQGGVNTLLFYDGDRRQQCCIGVACTALGIKDEHIEGLCNPESIVGRTRLPKAIRDLATLTERKVSVYHLNDQGTRDGDQQWRVDGINSDLRKHGIPLRFRLKETRRAKAAKRAKAERAVTPAASAAKE